MPTESDTDSRSESPPDVVALIEQARLGDEAARERLFHLSRNYVHVCARAQVESWLRTRVDSSDLVQQTLLDVHRAFDGFRGTTEAEWMVWVRQVLRRNAIDYVRRYRGTAKRQQRREVRLDGHGPDGDHHIDPRDPAASPSEVVMRRERELEVAEAVSRLPDDYREVIMLRNLQRLPFDEVALRMGRSRPAVQMLWTRALRKLRDVLKDDVDFQM
jgi:RNA polymerase sigma-70 factor (ECF subfamily)